MSGPSLVTVVGEEKGFQEHISYKWSTFVDGKDGFLYGIPHNARRVAKFNPVDKSMESIGRDLGGDGWDCGVLAKNGCIYCPPTSQKSHYNSGKMLKINTNDGTVITLDTDKGEWMSGALGADNCIYSMPCGDDYGDANHILRVDPRTDTLSYIRVPRSYFVGTVLGKDNCIYGLSIENHSRDGTVMRFDPMEPENISHFGNDTELNDEFATGGVLGNDGHIYALSNNGQVLKVDTSARTISSIGWSFEECRTQPIIGLDQCIYWPPGHTTRVLKFDPAIQQPPSYVGPDTPGFIGSGWMGGALASDGVIYCAPSCASQVLAIDPLRELSTTMKEMMRLYPDDLGRLFVHNNEFYSESPFESAVRKFGFARALRLLDECLPSDDEWSERHSTFDSVDLVKREASGDRKRKRSSDCMPLFVLAASGNSNVGDVPLIVIYHLLRRNAHGLLEL